VPFWNEVKKGLQSPDVRQKKKVSYQFRKRKANLLSCPKGEREGGRVLEILGKRFSMTKEGEVFLV